jgi:2-(1,2-epoxy-1,2-dihydrophenyl)acetyl-CoA isomerase
MEYLRILYQKEARVARLLLNRPRALNALDGATIEELRDALKAAAADSEVRVLILTGVGRAFCFGADVSEFRKAQEQGGKAAIEALLSKAQEIIQVLYEMPKPTLAALNGFASGLGLDLALACDLRIATDRVKVSEAFVSMGLVPDGGGTFFLPRLIGSGKAAEMILMGEPITSQEAEKIGLINRVVPASEFDKTVLDWAQKLAKGPSLAIGFAKQALKKNFGLDLVEALKVEAEFQKICLQSADHREALRSYLERREPIFEGK